MDSAAKTTLILRVIADKTSELGSRAGETDKNKPNMNTAHIRSRRLAATGCAGLVWSPEMSREMQGTALINRLESLVFLAGYS